MRSCSAGRFFFVEEGRIQTNKPIELNGRPIAGGKLPPVWNPLVGRTLDESLADLVLVMPKKPDVLEWRVDFSRRIGDTVADHWCIGD